MHIMKNFKTFAVAALLAVSATASAQFTNSSSSSSSSSANTGDWNTVWFEFSPNKFNVDVKDADDQSFTGLSLGYSHAFGLSQKLPLFLEAGLGLQYSFYSEEYTEYTSGDDKLKFNMFSAKVPVNLIYKFDLHNSNISLMPFLGAKLRFNFSAKQKLEIAEDPYEEDRGGESYELNLFDKEDMGSDKATWKRFQIGWQIGLKARFADKFLVGVSYSNDFSEIAKKIKVGGFNIAIGYTF